MRSLLLLLLLLGVTSALGYRTFKRSLRDSELIARSTNRLGFDFIRQLSKTQNVLISPISISMLMGLLYLGAANSTAAEISQKMQYSDSTHEAFKNILNRLKPSDGLKTSNQNDYNLEMANAILVDKSFNILQSYKDNSKHFYDAAVESVSFSLHPDAAVESVNGWVAWRTKNKITKVLQNPLEPLTKLFLMNAVYFKGTWKVKFDQRLTMPDTFYNNGLVPKTIPMMRQKRKLRYGFDVRIQAHALELPYNGDEVSMILLLPEQRDGLTEMESSMSNEMLSEIASNLREVTVQVTLPRLRLINDYDLIPTLKELRITSIFDPYLSDLTNISPKQGLYVTKAVHKCAIEVNEEGSEAAAVTGVSAGVRTGGPLVPQFNADHPFMFFIRDSRSGLNLFIGRVTNL